MTIAEYIQSLNATYQLGTATEHSYRPHLAQLLSAQLPDHEVTNEPARIECGAPDYTIYSKETQIPLVFIEAKDIGDHDLDGEKANREQFDRYKVALDHLIFTDYLEFRVYEHEAFVDSVRIGEVRDGHIAPLPEQEAKFQELVVNRIKLAQPQAITNATQLAEIMAGKAKILAQEVAQLVTPKRSPQTEDRIDSKLQGLYQSFREDLLPTLSPKGFADLYAQTIVYGMFAARLEDSSPLPFTRLRTLELIPTRIPFLVDLFVYVAARQLNRRLSWIIDNLAAAFNSTNLQEALVQWQSDELDPLMHFYEEFLAAYNPKLRKDKGVWYTPQPVVSFIVRAVDEILRTQFHLPQGLADSSPFPNEDSNHEGETNHRVQILDPATGTGTFLAEVIRQVHLQFKNNKGMWSSYVDQHLLPRLNGFEILMTPYVIAHLKLDRVLKETGYEPTHARPPHESQFNILLTNSLTSATGDSDYGYRFFVEREGKAAARVKQSQVMVMLGNPPYNGASTNKDKWILRLLDSYKREPGGEQALEERNTKWLNDDYVKFIRLAQNYIMRNPKGGVVAFITPHGFLDAPTFRGMRWHLLKAFDAIYTLDLHGNTRKRETAAHGGKDENVFNIMQGVSISFFIKTQEQSPEALAKVYHAEIYGTRREKFDFLDRFATPISQVQWQTVVPESKQYYFVKQQAKGRGEYSRGFGVNELFAESAVGVATSRDKLLVKETKREIRELVEDIASYTAKQWGEKYGDVETADWTLAKAKADVGRKPSEKKITSYAYRPFDTRYIYFTGRSNALINRPRGAISQYMQSRGNCALLTMHRDELGTRSYQSVFCARTLCDLHLIGSHSYVFPLYRLDGERRLIPNLHPEILSKIEKSLGEGVEPLRLFDYIYAVLHAPSYREKYRELLKIDFPRVPYPTNREQYEQLAALGAQLRELHLMEGAEQWDCQCAFPEEGKNTVEKIRWDKERVYINREQYFAPVPNAVWDFRIGVYSPAEKWLRDRKGKKLTADDAQHYARIIYALSRTIGLMGEVGRVLSHTILEN